MSIKAKTHNLNKPEDGNYGKTFNYICKDHDVQTCFVPGFFSTLAGNFMAGDSIRCMKIVKERITHLCEGIVLTVDIDGNKRTVDFRPITPKIITFPEENYLQARPQEMQEGEAREEFIKNDGVVKRNQKNKNYDVYMNDIVVCSTTNKTAADAIARGDRPIPEIPKFDKK
jgi:hypothetical protein